MQNYNFAKFCEISRGEKFRGNPSTDTDLGLVSGLGRQVVFLLRTKLTSSVPEDLSFDGSIEACVVWLV